MDRLELVLAADVQNALVQIAVDVVVERQPTVGARRGAPVDDVQVDALAEHVAHQRPVFLQIGHRITPDQAIDDEHRHLDLALGHRLVVIENGLVLPEHLSFGRRRDLDVAIARLVQEREPLRQRAIEFGDLCKGSLGIDLDATGHDPTFLALRFAFAFAAGRLPLRGVGAGLASLPSPFLCKARNSRRNS